MTTMTESTWIELEDAPAIPGLRARRWRDAGDYPTMAAVIAAANTHDGIPWTPTADNIRIQIDGQDGIDASSDITLVEIDGELVGEAEVWRVVRDGIVMFEIAGYVLPAFRRRGIGRALFRENVRRSAERAGLEPDGTPVVLESFVEDVETGHKAILAEAGFQPVRHFFLMRVDHLVDVPDAPLPDGLEIRTVTPDQHRAIFDAEAEAFKDHWGHREQTDDLFRTMFAPAELDTDLWAVAWDGDEIAGVVQAWIWPEENEKLGVQRGWLERISVRRAWRRRGLGRALTAVALRNLHDAGMAEAMLGVDSENPTGALGLYEGLGFKVYSRAAAHRRPLER